MVRKHDEISQKRIPQCIIDSMTILQTRAAQQQRRISPLFIHRGLLDLVGGGSKSGGFRWSRLVAGQNGHQGLSNDEIGQLGQSYDRCF